MASTQWLNPRNHKECASCGVGLPAHSPKNYCSKPACNHEWHKKQQETIKEKLKTLESKFLKEVDSVVNQWLDEKAITAEKINVIELPHTRLASVAVDEDRRTPFVEHLRHLLNTEDQIRDEKLYESPTKTKSVKSLEKVTGELCAMCRGKCCDRGGQNHAFIQRSTLKRVKSNHPELSNEDIIERYRSYFPEKATVNSCIYHSDTGCTLPSEYRANICSDFYCLNLSNYINEFEEGKNGEYDVFVMEQYYKIDSIKVVSSDAESGEVSICDIET